MLTLNVQVLKQLGASTFAQGLKRREGGALATLDKSNARIGQMARDVQYFILGSRHEATNI